MSIKKKELPKIIKLILDDLSEIPESLTTDKQVKEYVEEWVKENL